MNSELNTTMEIEWRVGFQASCLHAAEAIAHGRLITDMTMAEAVAPPARTLRQTITTAGLPRALFWRNLVGLAGITDGVSSLVERAVRKTVGASRAEKTIGEITGAVASVEAAVHRALPTLKDELSPRLPPMRRRWQTDGPPLLQRIARWTDPQLIAPRAQVTLAWPSLGGGGSAHLLYNNVLIEAVSIDPVVELPETLRLAWLLSQWNLDLPRFSETIHGTRLPHVAELAMIPIVLKVGEEVDMPRLDPETIKLALTSWNLMTPPDIDPVEILWRWWNTYNETRPRWDVAFTALDRMIE
ncbi:MAG: hypothetical protein R6U98_22590 [Pirellulaceae bacterium]